MRTSGLVSDPSGVDPADHVCWGYDDEAAFEAAALRFLRVGLDQGDRLIWIGDGATDRLRRSRAALAELERLADRGELEVVPLADAYSTTRSFSPAEQLEYYGARIDRARADGHHGLRVVAEVTALAADPRHAGDFLRWEHLGDDLAASGGFTALCAYRTTDVDPAVLADAVALHPVSAVPGTAPPVRVWIERDERGVRLAVAGEIDMTAADRFRRLLHDTHLDGPVLAVDLSRVTFLDLSGARAVAAAGRAVAARGGRLEVLGASRLFRRMWEIIGFAGVAEVSFPGDRR